MPYMDTAIRHLHSLEAQMIFKLTYIAAIIAIGFAWPRQAGVFFAISYLASGPMMRLWSIAFPSRKANDVLQIAPQ